MPPMRGLRKPRRLAMTAALLPSLGQARLAPALPKLFEKLSRSRDFGAVALLEAALVGTFGDAASPDDASALTPLQRELLVSLANNQAFWMLGNALNVLMRHHLPSERSEMAAFLGVEVVEDPIEAKRTLARMMSGFGAERALETWRDVLALDGDDTEALYGAAHARRDVTRAARGARIRLRPIGRAELALADVAEQ